MPGNIVNRVTALLFAIAALIGSPVQGQAEHFNADLLPRVRRAAALAPGDAVRITIYRGKKKMDVDITLGELREQV